MMEATKTMTFKNNLCFNSRNWLLQKTVSRRMKWVKFQVEFTFDGGGSHPDKFASQEFDVSVNHNAQSTGWMRRVNEVARKWV